MQKAETLDQWWCPIHFSLGSVCGWGVRGSLNVRDFSASGLTSEVADGVGVKLIPIVGAIRTSAALLAFLEKDDRTNPPLLQMGGYYRAAQIAFLARKLGVARAKTEEVLQGFAVSIGNGIDSNRFTPETYIRQILDDADAALAQATS
jgi:hypothetical protein